MVIGERGIVIRRMMAVAVDFRFAPKVEFLAVVDVALFRHQFGDGPNLVADRVMQFALMQPCRRGKVVVLIKPINRLVPEVEFLAVVDVVVIY